MTEIVTIWILLVFICHFSGLISGADDEKTLYRKVGGEVALDPGAAAGTEPITSIVWTLGKDLAVEWYGDEVEAYPHFKGRCQLSTATGVLTFKELIREDSGWYAAEINNKHTGRTHLQVMFPVPKPTISSSCDSGSTLCVLTCDGNTTQAEPVTYNWTTGDMMWMSSSKELIITWEEHSDDIEFSCTMMNIVSEERSEFIVNPLGRRHGYMISVNLTAGVVVPMIVVFAVVVVVVMVLAFRCKAGKPDDADQEPADESRREANGATADQAATQPGETTPMMPMMSQRQTTQSIAEDAQADDPEIADET